MAIATANRKTVAHMLQKVPEATLYFWVIKIMATTVGETAADFFNDKLNFGLTGTSLLMGVLLAFALVYQFRCRRYVPWIYWLCVVLISIVGTLVTDNLVENFHVSLWATSGVFALALAMTFIAWQASEKTLSIHSITTTKREAFYWTAILFTFALGTAAGDLIAEKLDLGYWRSVLLFAGCIAVIAVAYFTFHADAILTFWMAYVLTRPLGASMGDFLSQPHRPTDPEQSRSQWGIGLGTVGTSAIFLATILGVVVYISMRQGRDRTIVAGAL